MQRSYPLFLVFLLIAFTGLRAQNIGINTDGSVAETGVMLDVKGPTSKATTAPVSTLFQLKSLDANADALKLRFGFKTDAAAGNRYGFIDFPDFTAGTPTYLPLVFQPSGGNVGIGTTSPYGKLTIVQSANGYANGVLIYGDAVAGQYLALAVPAVAQAMIQSGNTATWQALLLNPSGGNVGIGTTTPSTRLEIAPAGGWVRVNRSANNLTNGYRLDLGNFDAYLWENYDAVPDVLNISTNYYKNNAGTDVIPNAGSYTARMQLGYSALGGTGTPGISFSTGNGVGIAPAIRMAITDAGNVGIGTTSPSYKLDIVSAAAGGIRVTGPTAGANGMVQIRDNDNAGGPHLTIWPSSSGNGVLRLQKSGISSWDFIDRSTSNDAAGTLKSLTIRNNNLGAGDIITFLGSGNVGIGTITPQGIFHIENGNARIITYDIDQPWLTPNRPAWAFGSSGPSFVVQSTLDYTTYTNRISIDYLGNMTVNSLAGVGSALVQADAAGVLSRSSVSLIGVPLIAIDVAHYTNPGTNDNNYVGLMAAYQPASGKVYVVSTTNLANIENLDVAPPDIGTPEWNPIANVMTWVDFGDPDGGAATYVTDISVSVNVRQDVATNDCAAIITVRMSNGAFYMRALTFVGVQNTVNAEDMDDPTKYKAWKLMPAPP